MSNRGNYCQRDKINISRIYSFNSLKIASPRTCAVRNGASPTRVKYQLFSWSLHVSYSFKYVYILFVRICVSNLCNMDEDQVPLLLYHDEDGDEIRVVRNNRKMKNGTMVNVIFCTPYSISMHVQYLIRNCFSQYTLYETNFCDVSLRKKVF